MLDLFGFSDPAVNLLPCDGEVHYFGRLITKQQADDYYNELMSNIAWENDQAIIFESASSPNAKWPGMEISPFSTRTRRLQNKHYPGHLP